MRSSPIEEPFTTFTDYPQKHLAQHKGHHRTNQDVSHYGNSHHNVDLRSHLPYHRYLAYTFIALVLPPASKWCMSNLLRVHLRPYRRNNVRSQIPRSVPDEMVPNPRWQYKLHRL